MEMVRWRGRGERRRDGNAGVPGWDGVGVTIVDAGRTADLRWEARAKKTGEGRGNSANPEKCKVK
jgi:hypothetical protein